MLQCDYLIPTFDPLIFIGVNYVPPDEKTWQCILAQNHHGPHVCENKADGGYLAWERDRECTDCYERGEECECFLHWEIGEQEAEQLLQASIARIKASNP